MSYDVDLVGPDGTVLPFSERFEEGGTYALGGVAICRLNITYNYYEVFGDLVSNLASRTGEETIADLGAFCERWAEAKPYERDYWAPTPGNARKAIARLRDFAREHPEGRWVVS